MRNRTFLVVLLSVLIAPAMARAADVTVNLYGPDGTTPLPGVGFRWIVEEDLTTPVIPGKPAEPGVDLSMSFHTSYMPVVSTGHGVGSATVSSLDPAKRYFVSVLPDSGYSISGTSFTGSSGSASVAVNALPLPTGQLSVLVFEDNNPINNAPEIPAERGLAGFTVNLVEAGGKRLNSARRNELRTAVGLPELAPDVAAVLATVPVTATVYQVGAGAADRVILLTPTTQSGCILSVNGDVRMSGPVTAQSAANAEVTPVTGYRPPRPRPAVCTLPVAKSTRARLAACKLPGETWDRLLNRLADNAEGA